MGDYTPVSSDQSAYTLTAGAVITGGQLVTVSAASTAIPSVSGDRSVGVAAHDAPSGGRFTCYVLPGMIHEVLILSGNVVTCPGTVLAAAAGTVKVGAGLAADAAAGTLLGMVLRGGTGDGTTVKAKFIGI